MTTPGRRQLHRSTLRVAAALVLGLAALSFSGPAAAASCGKRVIDDWNADGRVDGTYALQCYDDAIEALPRDVRDYSSAKEDIERAMQAAMRQGDTPSGSDDHADGPAGGPGGAGPDEPTGTGPGAGDTPGETETGASPEVPVVDTASSDSVPLPLLVLAALALLLIAAGSLGYVVRRVQARRGPPPSL